MYNEWCAIARGSQYNVNERRGSIYAHCTTGHSLCFLYSNKWPTRGFWNEISLLCTFPVFPPQLVLSGQDFPLSTGGGRLERKRNFFFLLNKEAHRLTVIVFSDTTEDKW